MKIKLTPEVKVPLVRTNGLRVEVPDFRMIREDRQIHCMGMVHLAEREFFEARSRAVLNAPDSVVLMEGTEKSVDPEFDALHDRRLARMIGDSLVFQAGHFLNEEGRGTESRCVFADLPVAKGAVEANRADTVSPAVAALVESYLPPSFEAIFRNDSIEGIFASCSHSEKWHCNDDPRLLERNDHLMTYIEGTRGNVIVPWGVAHFPDLVRKLRGQGWMGVPDSVQFVPFMKIPTWQEEIKAYLDLIPALGKLVAHEGKKWIGL